MHASKQLRVPNMLIMLNAHGMYNVRTPHNMRTKFHTASTQLCLIKHINNLIIYVFYQHIQHEWSGFHKMKRVRSMLKTYHMRDMLNVRVVKRITHTRYLLLRTT